MSAIVKTDFTGVHKKINNICKSDKVGLFMASECRKFMEPYVPMDTGMLAQTATVTPFNVTYEQPYATYVYQGNGMHFSKDKHPLATSHWEKPMITARANQLSNELTAYIKGMI